MTASNNGRRATANGHAPGTLRSVVVIRYEAWLAAWSAYYAGLRSRPPAPLQRYGCAQWATKVF